uniref:Pyruvate kinase n=1 Tax=Amphora coffeiformis TaxID=265554 RepID=A0A7S3LCL2_9STRA|mmetsp:Transcript_824/g.1811  ORF Transcript_824/g.1811 Transcript_824/m.1811 type:complete len:560 (-) Transcript_824:1097-2776(-)
MMFGRLTAKQLRRHTTSKIAKRFVSARLELPKDVAGTRTKVVCTIGPSTDQEKPIGDLVSNGMSVARLNFSHSGADYTYPETILGRVRAAKGRHAQLATSAGMAVPPNVRAILVDTKGPEIRTGVLPGDAPEIQIVSGSTVELHIHDVTKEDPAAEILKLNIDYKSIAKTVDVGSQILLDDGLIALEVTEIDPKAEFVKTIALNGGPIKKNKGVNLPGATLDLPALTDKDKRDLEWACKVGADFVAASFIRTPENVRSVVSYLDRVCSTLPDVEGGRRPLRPLVISKIESKEGVDNFDEILKESDGIMVARGDLGVEIPYSKVFAAQRMMVTACNKAGKPVIVATQMLDSMMRNPRPTRAEVTDVGTAVLDGTDAVMLSGETAAGKYPIESIKAMVSVVWEADRILNARKDPLIWNQELHDEMSPMEQELDAVSASAVRSARDMKAKAIILITMTGRVARAVVRHRPSVPVLAFCLDPQVARRLQLHRSLYPIMLQSSLDPGSRETSMSVLRAEAVRVAKEMGHAKVGDRIIMVDRTVGKGHDLHEYAHNMKVVTLKEV